MDVYRHVQTNVCVNVCRHVLLCVDVCGRVHVCVLKYVWMCVDVSESVQLVSVCRCVQMCADMRRRVQMSVDMCVPLQQQSSRASPPLRLPLRTGSWEQLSQPQTLSFWGLGPPGAQCQGAQWAKIYPPYYNTTLPAPPTPGTHSSFIRRGGVW